MKHMHTDYYQTENSKHKIWSFWKAIGKTIVHALTTEIHLNFNLLQKAVHLLYLTLDY